MSNGTVKFFNESKGFGFITPDEGGKDVFVHANGLIDEINEGDKVSFDVEESSKRIKCIECKSNLRITLNIYVFKSLSYLTGFFLS